MTRHTLLTLLFSRAALAAACHFAAASAFAQDVAPSEQPSLFIREYRVQGSKVVSAADIQDAIQPYLGPARTLSDVEAARAALENLYRSHGYQAAIVEVPPQQARKGVIFLRVNEGEIGRLRVVGSRYHEPARIHEAAPSLAEGRAPDFDEISKDIVALNRSPGRRVIPEIKSGGAPGVIDVDLKVEDEPPLHASAELNNRYSSDTTKLRLNLAASYDNLWQAGHAIGGSLQTTPEDWFDEVMVYSGFYLARFAGLPDWTFQFSATKQDSNISTLSGIAVAGRGDVFSLRATRILPAPAGMFHSFSFGIDRKNYTQQVNIAGTATKTPVTYFPIGLLYSGAYERENSLTEFFAGATLHLRGMGGDSSEFDRNRFGAEPNFISFRTDLTHRIDLPGGFKITGRGQGQLASGPLLSNEQFAAGGLDTVRGYLEGEVLGDHGVVGGVELSAPPLLPEGRYAQDLTLLGFVDAGYIMLAEPLPQQTSRFELAGAGLGLRARLFRHFDGSLHYALPLFDEGNTEALDPHLIFVIRGSM